MPSESGVIAATLTPVTRASIVNDLRALGVAPGDVMIVHSSLSALGWVVGGAQAAVLALLDAVSSEGTLVMPTQSAGLSDPAGWSNPPVPVEWFDEIRAEMPLFDPALTSTRGMGEIVECFRHHPSTRRSSHPLWSLAANGLAAEEIVGRHPLTPGLGETSPLGRLYDLDANVLLIGANHGSNTSLHLAEYRADWAGKSSERLGAPQLVDGVRIWQEFDDIELDESDFDRIGEAFAATGGETTGLVAQASARLCRQREIVDFATDWMSRNR